MSNLDYFDEPDGSHDDENIDPEPVDPLQEVFTTMTSADSFDSAATPINTMSYFDEPEPSLNYTQESSASPPPPNNNLHQEPSSSASKPVDVIPEEQEKDRYNDGDEENEDENVDDDEEEDEHAHIANLENELETIRNKLEAIKVENMLFSQEMSESAQHTTLTKEYDEKIMFYDEEFHKQQQIIIEEEKLIKEFQEEFDRKIKEYNVDDEMLKKQNIDQVNGIIRNNGNQSMHQQHHSIVLYDNSFAINHQLQQEIDKLTTKIEWLQTSKIQLVKNTCAEVDRLRSIIKKLQGNDQ